MTTATDQRAFAALYREKLELQDRLNVVTKQLSSMQDGMLEYFAETGQSKATIDDLTLFIHEQLWANTKEGSTPEEACEAMVRNGMESFVAPRFNTQTLSSYARELAAKGKAFPTEVLKHIEVKPKVEIRARRS